MLRKLFAILVTVCLLAGCTAAPGETAPETTQGTIPETTPETTQEITPETTEETTPEPTEADTRQYVYTDGAFCYHIPVVELPGVDAGEMNEKLYGIYEKLLQEMVFSIPREERFLLGLTYEVGRKGDVVSVTVLQRGDCDLDSYDVYHFSASTGKELRDDQVYAAFDMTPAEGVEMIRKAMEANFNMAEKMDGPDDPFFLEQKEKTLADSNLKLVRPLIAETGELQFVGEFYSLAGADSYWHRFDQAGEFLQMTCTEHN